MVKKMKASLTHGATVVADVRGNDGFTIAATVKLGHINEPKLGIASVYEKILMLQNPNVQTVYGGTITSYLTGGASEKEIPEKVAELLALMIKPVLSDELLNEAVSDIIRHTRDRNVLPRRQLKLLYKHTAFHGNQVWDTEAYIRSLLSITLEDLQNLHKSYYTGKNLVITFSGKGEEQGIFEAIMQNIADLPVGEEQKVELPEYTGGYAVLASEKPLFSRVLVGWDVTSLERGAEANVLMSILANRLDRSFANEGLEVTTELKIAGYYGCRTLRIAAECADSTMVNKMLDIIAYNIKRLKETYATDRRMESARNEAMADKLFKFGQREASAVEIAWQILKHGRMYDISDRIISTWRVSARNVQEVANEIFSQPFTCCIYGQAPYYSKEELAKMF